MWFTMIHCSNKCICIAHVKNTGSDLDMVWPSKIICPYEKIIFNVAESIILDQQKKSAN